MRNAVVDLEQLPPELSGGTAEGERRLNNG